MGDFNVLVIGNVTLDTVYEVNNGGVIVQEKQYFGGRGANIAVIGAKLGLKMSLATFVGDDFYSSHYSEFMRNAHVDISNVHLVKGERCARTVGFRQPSGETNYYFQPNVQSVYRDLPMSHDHLDNYRAIYVTSFDSHQHIEDLYFNLRRLHGVFYGAGEELFRKDSKFIRRILNFAEYILLNRGELDQMCKLVGVAGERALFRFSSSRLKCIVATMGAKGCALFTRSEEIYVPAIPLESKRTDLGAGDAFAAGFIFGVLRDCSLLECARIGTLVAAFAMQHEFVQRIDVKWSLFKETYKKMFGEQPLGF